MLTEGLILWLLWNLSQTVATLLLSDYHKALEDMLLVVKMETNK